MAVISNISIGMRVNYAPMTKDLAKASATIGRFASRVSSGIGTAMGRVGVAGSVAAVTGIGAAGAAIERLGAVGKVAAATGIGAVAGAATMAAKVAGDFEASMAEVSKTTGFAAGEMAELRAGIRALATDPAMAGIGHQELAGIAESAGQMGLAAQGGIEGMLEFTKAVGMLGIALPELEATEAARSIAQILGQFKLDPAANTLGFASALNALAQNAKAGAPQLVDMAHRIKGAAEKIGMSAPEVLALSTTILDSGLSTEVAGTAMQQVMLGMYGDTKAFAAAAGVPFERFAGMLRNKPLAAIEALSLSIGKLDAFESVRVLENLGIDGELARMVLMQLGGNIGRLSGDVAMANAEFATASSIFAEVAITANTTWSSLRVLWNQVKDLGIEFGQHLLPIIKGAGQGFAMLSGDIKGLLEDAGPALAAFGAGMAERVRSVGVLMTHWRDAWELARVTFEEKSLQIVVVAERLVNVLANLFGQVGRRISQEIEIGLRIAARDLSADGGFLHKLAGSFGDAPHWLKGAILGPLSTIQDTLFEFGNPEVPPGPMEAVSLNRAMADAGLSSASDLFANLPNLNDRQAEIQARINAALAARSAPAEATAAASAPAPVVEVAPIAGQATAAAVAAALKSGNLSGAAQALADGVFGGLGELMRAKVADGESALPIANTGSGEDAAGRGGGYAAALEMGSVEARRAVLGHRLGIDPAETTARNTTMLAEEARQQTSELRRLNEQIGGGLSAAFEF